MEVDMSVMKNELSKAKHDLEALLVSLGEKSRLLGAGNLAVKISDESGADELRLRALSSRERLEKIDKEIRRIRALLSEKEDVERRIEELVASEKELSERRTRLYGEIGRKGFESYQKGTLTDERFSILFSEIGEYSDREKQALEELRDLEASKERSPLLKRITFGAKITLAKNNLTGLRKEQDKAYFKAGEALFGQEFASAIVDPQLLTLIATFRESERREEELRGERSEAEKKRQDLVTQLADAGADKNSTKCLRDLEQKRAEGETAVAESDRDYGATLLLMPELRELIRKEGDTSLLEEVAELEKNEEFLRTRIAALEAGIEAEEKREELEKQRTQLEKVKRKREELDTEMKEIKKRISEGEKELNRLLEVADVDHSSASDVSE